MMEKYNFERLIRNVTKFTMSVLVIYLILANLTPFGAQSSFSSEDLTEISKLTPPGRVEYISQDGIMVAKQSGDLTYFSTPMPFKYEHATVRINFENPYPDQSILLGYQDEEGYSYTSRLIDSPLINSLNWNKTGDGPYLYQRFKNYSSASEFVSNPPKEMIGVYQMDIGDFIDDKARLSGYSPGDAPTYINTPIRGSHTFYVYLENEGFQIGFQKQDLNWYADEDILTVNVYKGDDLVYSQSVGDDGIADSSKVLGRLQEFYVTNPGPELPEPGIYRVSIETSGDVVTRAIVTNLSKIVWQGPLYLVSNADIYKGLVETTQQNVLYASGLKIGASTAHGGALQDIAVGDKVITLEEASKTVSVESPGNVQITIPKSDVVLSGSGFFVFSRDQFFWPTRVNIVSVNSQADLENINYVLTKYTPSQEQEDGSRTAIVDFDLNSAFLKDGKLSWRISAPGLSENQRHVIIKKIEMQMFKKGWFQ